jgi:cadmium resistance protein CadD (predicted permease)
MNKLLFVLAGTYLGAIGLALLIVPAQFGVDAVPKDPSPELIALLRLLGGPFLGIAVLNWMSRNAEAATIRNTVVLANLIGFGVVAGNDIVGVLTGNARDLARVFLIVHLAFAIAFAVVWARPAPSPATRP